LRADSPAARNDLKWLSDPLEFRDLHRSAFDRMTDLPAPLPWLVSNVNQTIASNPDQDAQRYGAIATGLEAGGALFSVGALLWVTRSVGVLAAMLTALPTWRGLDPLVLLAPEQPNGHSMTTQRNTELLREEADAEAIFDHLK